jgi:hypothetical protein
LKKRTMYSPSQSVRHGELQVGARSRPTSVGSLQPSPAAMRPARQRSAECALQLRAAVESQHVALVRRVADLVDHAGVLRPLEECAISVASSRLASSERQVYAMTAHKCIGLAVGVASEARPAKVARFAHEPGADRVRLDVPAALEEIPLGVDERGTIATFPERPRAPVTPVEILHVTPAERLHHSRWRLPLASRDEQVYVIRHQDVRVNRAARVSAGATQRVQITRAIDVVDETAAAVVTALDEMKSMAGKDGARWTGHAEKMRSGARAPTPNGPAADRSSTTLTLLNGNDSDPLNPRAR